MNRKAPQHVTLMHPALEKIEPYREALRQHEMYGAIKTLDDVRVFMESHIFAVWDFMCLLKALQRSVTCVDTPWVPRGDPQTRRLINEIVTGEESDQLSDGRCLSHFEMYLQAMADAGADVKPINCFVDDIRAGHPVQAALARSGAPLGAHDFVSTTMAVVEADKPYAIAAAFAIGREEIIPTMFIEIVRGIAALDSSLRLFEDYLQRHIQLDGDEHSKLAAQMLANLCEGDEEKWEESAAVAIGSLRSRVSLWDSVTALLVGKPYQGRGHAQPTEFRDSDVIECRQAEM
jgi:hypothetical protein